VRPQPDLAAGTLELLLYPIRLSILHDAHEEIIEGLFHLNARLDVGGDLLLLFFFF
jgi:hypothetical protein